MVRETRYLIVRNLPENCTEETVIDHFQRYGKIQSVKLQAAKDNDADSTATVAFNDIKSAAKAHHAKNSIGEVTLRTDYWEGSTGTPVLANTAVAGSSTVRSTAYSSTAVASSRLVSAFPSWTKGTCDEDGANSHDKGDIITLASAIGVSSSVTASAALDKLSSTSFDLQRGRGRERIKPKKFGQKFEKSGSFGRHGTTTSTRSLEAARSQSEAAAAAAAALAMSSSATPATTSGSSSNGSGNTSGLNPIIVSDTKDMSSRDLKERNRESVSRPHSVSSPSSRSNSGVKRSNSQSRSVSHSRSRSRGSRSSSCRSHSSGTSQSTSPHRSHTSSTTRPQSMVGTSRLVNSEVKEAKRDDDGERRPLGICIMGLPLRSTDSSLRDGLYHEYKKNGKVTTVQICGDGEGRCAVVSFRKPEDAIKALEASQGKVFFGAKIKVASHEGVEVDDTDRGNDIDSLDEYHVKSTRTLFVGNLEKETTTQDLIDKFKQFGDVIDVDIKRQGASTAFAFVQYSDIASVVSALRAMEGEHIGINKIKLGFGKSMPTSCVWVDCLPSDANNRLLRTAMSRYGEVTSCFMDRNRSKGLVFFSSYEDAQRCVNDIKMRPHFMKKKLQIDFASRECQTDFLDRMETTGQLRANERPDESRGHKFRQQRSFDSFQEDGSPTAYGFNRTSTGTFPARNGRSSSGSTSYRRSRQYGDTTFPEENHSGSRRTRRPEEFSQPGQFYSGKGSTDDYDAVLREYGHSQRERRERDVSPRHSADRRVDGQSRQSSRDHSLDRYDKDRTVEIYNSRDTSPGSDHNSYHSDSRYRSSRDDKYTSRDRYEDTKTEDKDFDHHSKPSRNASPYPHNHSSSHSHDSDYEHRGGSRSQSPPTPIQEDTSIHRMYYSDDYKRSVEIADDYSSYSGSQKQKDADDVGSKAKTVSILSNKLGAEVIKTAGKSRKRTHEESGLSDLNKLDAKLLRKSDKSISLLEKGKVFSEKEKKLHYEASRQMLKGHERAGSPGSSASHGDSENGSVSEGDLHHLHQEKHHILRKLQELNEEGVGTSEPDSPRSVAKVKSVAVKEALRLSGRSHDERKCDEVFVKGDLHRRQGVKVRGLDSRRESRNHVGEEMSSTREDKSLLDEKDESFGGNSDSDYGSDFRRTKKRRTDANVDIVSVKNKGYRRTGSVDVSDEDLDRKSDHSFRIHSSSVVKRVSCDSRMGSKSYADPNKTVEVSSCDSSDLFKDGLSDKDLSVIKQPKSVSKSNTYFPNKDWNVDYGGHERSPVGCFSPACSEDHSQDSVTSGSLTEKSSKHLSPSPWQHSPPASLTGKDNSDGDYGYYKDFTIPGSTSPDDCLSDDSLGEELQPQPGEPSVEERIRAIDEMLNMTASNKSSDPALLMSVLSNKDISNNNDNSALYSKFRIRKRESGLEGGNGSLLADRKPEPSVIMQQVLSKKSILDQDFKRLEQMSEKYDFSSGKDLSSLLKSEAASPKLTDLKEGNFKPLLSPPSLLSSSSHPVTTSSSMLQPTVTTTVAGSAPSSFLVLSASVLTTSILSAPVTTCSIHTSAKPAAVDSFKKSRTKSSENSEDVSDRHPVCTNSLTLKPDVIVSSSISSSSVPLLTSSSSLLSSLSSSLVTESATLASSQLSCKFVVSPMTLPSSLLSPPVSSASISLSSAMHSKTNLQQSVLMSPYTSSLSTSSSSLSATQSASGASAAAPFTQGPDKSQLMPTVGQEAPHLCSPSFTPENSRTSVSSHLPGSRSPRVASHTAIKDDPQKPSSETDLKVSVFSETDSKTDELKANSGAAVTPDIESPISVQSETSSIASVPLSSIDSKTNLHLEEKVLAIPPIVSPQSNISLHGSGLNLLFKNSDSAKTTMSLDLATEKTVQDMCDKGQESFNKNLLKCNEATEAADVLVSRKMEPCPSVTVQAVLCVSSKDHSEKELPYISEASNRGKSGSSSVLHLSSDTDPTSALKAGPSSITATPSTPISASTISRPLLDRSDKKVSGKNNSSYSKMSSGHSKSEALFAPDVKMEQLVKSSESRLDMRHQSVKGASNKSNNSDKKSTKLPSKDVHENKEFPNNRELDKAEKRSDLEHKSSVAQESTIKNKEVNKVKDKRDQTKDAEKGKQKDKEEVRKKEDRKTSEKKAEKKALTTKDDKKGEKKGEDRKDRSIEKSKESAKSVPARHSKLEANVSKQDKKQKEKVKDASSKDKDKPGDKKVLAGLSCVAKTGLPEVKQESKSFPKSDFKETKSVKSDSAKDSAIKSEKEAVQKAETPGKSDQRTAKHKSDTKVTNRAGVDVKSENKDIVAATASTKKSSEVPKSKKEVEKEGTKTSLGKQSDKLLKLKQREEEKMKEKQRLKEEREKQKEKEEKEKEEREKQKEKEKEEKERREREEKEKKEKEEKERLKEEREKLKEKEREERERQKEKEREEKERQKEKEKEERERKEREREESERQKEKEKEEKERQKEKEREAKEKQKEKQREEKEKQKEKEREEKEKQKEKEREEKEKQKEKEREEKERQKEKEKEERERQKEKEKEERERQKEKEKEERERQKEKEKEEREKKEKEDKERLKKEKEEREKQKQEEREKQKQEEREKQKQKERDEDEPPKEKRKLDKKTKEKEEKQKDKEKKEKEKKDRKVDKKEKEKKAKEDKLRKDKEERAKKDKDEKTKPDKAEKEKINKEKEKEKAERERKEKEEKDKKKLAPKKPKRNELAALLEHNDMIQMSFTSMYDRVKTQRNREPEQQHKAEPAPKSSFDKFKQHRKKNGSKVRSSLYSFDTSSGASDDDVLSDLSEDESSQKAEPVKEAKPKKTKQIKRPHVSSSSSSSCEEDDDALLRATKPKGQKTDKFSEIFSSDSEDDNFQPPSNKLKVSAKTKVKPVPKRRKNRDDSSDSVASRDEFVKPQAKSSVTDSLDDMDLSEEEDLKNKRKKIKAKAAKSSDHEERDSSIESVSKKPLKVDPDLSESVSKKSTKVDKDESPTKKSKLESKKATKTHDTKPNVKEENKSAVSDKKKGKSESEKTDSKIEFGSKNETRKSKSKVEPEKSAEKLKVKVESEKSKSKADAEKVKSEVDKSKSKVESETTFHADKLKTKDQDKPKHKDEDKPRLKVEEKLKSKDDEKVKLRDDEKAKSRDDEKAKSRDDEKVKSKDDEKAKSRDDEKPKSRDDEKPKSRDDEKPKPRDDEKIKLRDDEKVKSREDEKVKSREDEKVKSREDEKVKSRDDEKVKSRDDEKVKSRDDEKAKSRDEEKVKSRNDEKVKSRDDEKVKSKDDEKVKSRDDDKAKPKDAERTKPRDDEKTKSKDAEKTKSKDEETHKPKAEPERKSELEKTKMKVELENKSDAEKPKSKVESVLKSEVEKPKTSLESESKSLSEKLKSATESESKSHPEKPKSVTESESKHPENPKSVTESESKSHPEKLKSVTESESKLHPEKPKSAMESESKLHLEKSKSAVESDIEKLKSKVDPVSKSIAEKLMSKVELEIKSDSEKPKSKADLGSKSIAEKPKSEMESDLEKAKFKVEPEGNSNAEKSKSVMESEVEKSKAKVESETKQDDEKPKPKNKLPNDGKNKLLAERKKKNEDKDDSAVKKKKKKKYDPLIEEQLVNSLITKVYDKVDRDKKEKKKSKMSIFDSEPEDTLQSDASSGMLSSHDEKPSTKDIEELELVKPKEDKPDVSKESAKPDLSKESAKPDLSKESAKPDLSKESAKPDLSKESAKPDLSKESAKPDLSKESAKPDLSKESAKPDLSKESAKPDLSKESAKIDVSKDIVKPDVNKDTVKPDVSKDSAKSDVNKDTVKPDVSKDSAKSDINKDSAKSDVIKDSAKPDKHASAKLSTEEISQVSKKKHKKRKDKKEPQKEPVGKNKVLTKKDQIEKKEKGKSELPVKQAKIAQLEDTSEDEHLKPPKKKKKKKELDRDLDKGKEKISKFGKSLQKKAETEKCQTSGDEKDGTNLSDDKSSSQIVDEFTSFWGHPKPILIPKRLKDSKKTDDDKCKQKDHKDESKSEGSSDKSEDADKVKEEPIDGKDDKLSFSDDKLLDSSPGAMGKMPDSATTPKTESEICDDFVVPISEAETTVVTEVASIATGESICSIVDSLIIQEETVSSEEMTVIPDETTVGSSVEIDDDDFPSLVIDEIPENSEKKTTKKDKKLLKKQQEKERNDHIDEVIASVAMAVSSDDEDQPSLVVDSTVNNDQELLLSDVINQELKYDNKISSEVERKSNIFSDMLFRDKDKKEKVPEMLLTGGTQKDRDTKLASGPTKKEPERKKETLKSFGPLDEETKKRDEELLKTLAVLCDPNLDKPVVIEDKKHEPTEEEIRKKEEAEKKKAEEEKKKAEEEEKARREKEEQAMKEASDEAARAVESLLEFQSGYDQDSVDMDDDLPPLFIEPADKETPAETVPMSPSGDKGDLVSIFSSTIPDKVTTNLDDKLLEKKLDDKGPGDQAESKLDPFNLFATPAQAVAPAPVFTSPRRNSAGVIRDKTPEPITLSSPQRHMQPPSPQMQSPHRMQFQQRPLLSPHHQIQSPQKPILSSQIDLQSPQPLLQSPQRSPIISKDSKMDSSFIITNIDVPTSHSGMDINHGHQSQRRVSAGLSAQPILETSLRPLQVSPRRKSQEFPPEQLILSSRRNTISVPEEASVTHLDRQFPPHIGSNIIMSKERTHGISSLPPPVSISLDHAPHDSNSQSPMQSLTVPPHQESILLSPKKVSPGLQFKDRTPDPPIFSSAAPNKSTLQDPLSHFLKSPIHEQLFAQYPKGPTQEQLFCGTRGPAPDFFKVNKMAAEQHVLIPTKSAMTDKQITTKGPEPMLVQQKSPAQELTLQHVKGPQHVLEHIPQHEKSLLTREPLFSPKGQSDHSFNYPDPNIDFLLNSPPRNNLGFTNFPPSVPEVNISSVPKQPDYSQDPLFIAVSEVGTRPTDREPSHPRRAEGFPASFYQEPVPAPKAHTETETVNLPQIQPAFEDDKKGTRKRKRSNKKTTNEDRAAALAEQQAIEESVQANVDSIRKALNANQAKAAAEKAGMVGTEKKKTLDAYDFEAHIVQDMAGPPGILATDPTYPSFSETDVKPLRSRNDRGRGRGYGGVRRGRRGRGAISSVLEPSDALQRSESQLHSQPPSHFPGSVPNQDHLQSHIQQQYHHQFPPSQQPPFQRQTSQPNQGNRQLPHFYPQSLPSPMSSDNSSSLPALDWQQKQVPHQHNHIQQQLLQQQSIKLPVTKNDVLSPESNKQDLDLSYGESELIINLDDQPSSTEGKENQYNLSSDGEERGLIPSPSTPKSQRSTRARKQPDYKAIASGNVPTPVQPRSSRSGGSPRGLGNGVQSPKNMSPRTRSTENISSSPVVKLEKLEVGRTTRSRREVGVGKGYGKDNVNEVVTPAVSFEDHKTKPVIDESRSISKENIYEFVDNEHDQLVETSLRSVRARKKRVSENQEFIPQQPMPDYMPASPASSSNSSLFVQEPKHGFDSTALDARPMDESVKPVPLSSVDAIIEAVAKGNFGSFEEDQSSEVAIPAVSEPEHQPAPPPTRASRRSTEAKKEADAKAEKTFTIAEPPRFEGREGGRKGPTVPPLRIKVAHGTKVEKNEEKHYVIERAKVAGPVSEHEKPPLAFTVKLSDSGTATIKPAGVAGSNPTTSNPTISNPLTSNPTASNPTTSTQLIPPGVKNQTFPAGDIYRSDIVPKKDGSLGLFSGLPQNEQQNNEMDLNKSSIPNSQAPSWKSLETITDETAITRLTAAMHPKVAAKVQASQESQNSVPQIQTSLAQSLQQYPPSSAPSSISSLSKSSPVTPATPHGLKHAWTSGLQQDPQHQPTTSDQTSPSSYLPTYIQTVAQISALTRDAQMHQQQPSGVHQEAKQPPNAHSQSVLHSDRPGKASKSGVIEMNADRASKLTAEAQKHLQGPFGFPPHVPPAHSGQRTFIMPSDQPGHHAPPHFPNSSLLKSTSDSHPSKSPSIQTQAASKIGPEIRTQTPPVTPGAMLYAGVVSGQPHSLSPTSASPEGQVIERIQNPIRQTEPGQPQATLSLHLPGSHHQDPGSRFMKDDVGQDGSTPLTGHNERTPTREMAMFQHMLEQQRLQQHLLMAEAARSAAQEAARNSAPDSARNIAANIAMRNVLESSRNTPVTLDGGRKGPLPPTQPVGHGQPLNLTPQSESRGGQADTSRVTPKSTPPAPQSPFSMSYFERKGDSGRLSATVAGSFMQPSPGGHREGLNPHLYPELSLANLTAHSPYMVGRLPIDPRIYGSGQQPPPHLMRDGVLPGSFSQAFPPGTRFPGLEHPDAKKGDPGHPDQTAAHMLRSPSPIHQRQLQADALRQQLTRMPCDLPTRDSPVGFLQRYPVMWQGALALKNDNSYVQMHFIAGNRRLPNQALPQPMQNGALPPLRISQRMRLEHAQLEGVAKRMQCEDHYCILIAVACGRDQMDINQQTRALNEGFITYLLSKQAAGIVNVPLPGSEQVRFVVHIFPPCEFVDNSVAQQGSVVLMEQLREVPHAVVIIATT